MLLSFVYWFMLIIMGPVTVFGLGNTIYQDALQATIQATFDTCVTAATGTGSTSDEAIAACTVVQDTSTLMWLGVVIFWVVMLIVIIITLIMHKGTKQDWYRRVFLYGAWELADIVANRSDELREEG